MKRSILRKIAAGSAALLAAISLIGCTAKIAVEDYAKTVVATFGDENIYLSEPIFFLRSNQMYMEMLYSGSFSDMSVFWSYQGTNGKTYGNSLKEDAMAAVLQTRILKQNAGSYGVELTEADNTKINEAATEYFATINESLIAATGVTEDILIDIYTNNAIANKVWEAIVADVDTYVSDEEARQVSISYIQVDTDTDDPDWAKTTAEAMLARAEAGEDLDTIAGDYDMAANPMTLGANETIELNTTAMSLKSGEFAMVTNGENGYYVIYCVSELDETATNTRKDAIISERKAEIFNTVYESLKASAPKFVLVDKVWDTINLDTMIYVPETTSDVTVTEETTMEASIEETTEEETAAE